MNDQRYQLILKILDSDLPKETKDEIVRFYLLPRNTPVIPFIELPEEPEDLGVVKRPSPHDIDRKNNPQMAAEEDAMKDTLKGRI